MGRKSDIETYFKKIKGVESITYICEKKNKILEVYVYNLEPDYLWGIYKKDKLLEEGTCKYDQKLTTVLRRLYNKL